MSTLSQNNSEVPQGLSLTRLVICNNYMYFNLGIQLGNCNKTTSTCTCISTTIPCISIRPVQCANTVLLLSYLLQCISLHYYALLLFVKPCPDGIQMAHNLRVELFVYLVSVGTEAGHIGSMTPVRELFINEYYFTVMFSFYLS